jgi:hypothetical protein
MAAVVATPTQVRVGNTITTTVTVTTSHTDGTASAVVTLTGALVRTVNKGGTPAPDTWAFTITDARGVQVVAATGRHASNGEQSFPTQPIFLLTGNHTVAFTGLGSGKSATVDIITKA